MRVWIDITNSPHVLFFAPIIKDLQAGGHSVTVTAREYAQTVDLLDRTAVEYRLIGRHRGPSRFLKALGLVSRSLRLAMFAFAKRFDVAFSHNSNDLAVAAWLLRLPHLVVHDYEHADLSYAVTARLATRLLVPEAISIEDVITHGASREKVVRFPGLKEHVYLTPGPADVGIRDELGISTDEILVVARPPATMSAYHPAHGGLFEEVLEFAVRQPGVIVVLLPRTAEQAAGLSHMMSYANVVVPYHALDGQSLIKCADLVISAGGTMNREAAVLGTPAYTVFAGEMGAVDRMLINRGLLVHVTNPADIVFRHKHCRGGGYWEDNRGRIIEELESLCTNDHGCDPP